MTTTDTKKTDTPPETEPRTYHVAVDTADLTTGQISSAYLGICDQAHVDEVRALAALPAAGRLLIESPRQPGAFFVLRAETEGSDGDLDRKSVV